MGIVLSPMSRSVALALVGSAAAFSPMMSMDLGRRSIVQAGAASAVAAPLLRPQEAQAGLPVDALCAGKACNSAPVITIFDHRGCKRGGPNAEYTGEAAGGADDEMCVKVQMGKPTSMRGSS